MSTRFQAGQQDKLRRFQTDQRKVQSIMNIKTKKQPFKQRMPKRNTVGMPTETALRFIKLVKRNSCLWNPNHRQFRDKNQQEKTWHEMSEALGFSVEELKDKWVSLKSSFRAYQLKFVSDPEKARKWFAFDAMEFLATTSRNRDSLLNLAAVQHHDDAASPHKEELMVEMCKEEEETVEYYEEDEDGDGDVYSGPQTPATMEEAKELEVKHSLTTINKGEPVVVVQPPMDNSANALLDRSTIFGQSISLKLKYLDRRQQMLAEKIISDIMFEAELGNLTTGHVWDIQKILRNVPGSATKHGESLDE